MKMNTEQFKIIHGADWLRYFSQCIYDTNIQLYKLKFS
jgi:hypothetical protein